MTQITSRERMIDAAEELIAEGGIAAMTLRQVHARAGQSNRVAAQYHFGSKSGLIAAVVERRMSIINEHRRVILSRIGQAGRAVTSRELVEALTIPFVQETVMRKTSYYARFLVQCMNDPLFVDMIYEKSYADTVREVMDRLVERSPLPVETARNRAMNMAHLIAVTVARIEGSITEIDDLPARITDLVDSCVGLFEAPTTLVGL
ncbi:TetR/AcrR family transcriptional regulator [Rhodococcus sp. 14C212]|uniref:TetR family transcriptional regulator n=1 Tax=Rhodococcus sp. 14C212 TaxID=2711209 RepID=UPI0013EC0406|nr:TetR/AcrR family transcriptional regulator [Rhodococcus sp. 14C212]NGP05140.1 TetR/AcrR family transcriptional regulator [Rhodococcus sp. 14C212]